MNIHRLNTTATGSRSDYVSSAGGHHAHVDHRGPSQGRGEAEEAPRPPPDPTAGGACAAAREAQEKAQEEAQHQLAHICRGRKNSTPLHVPGALRKTAEAAGPLGDRSIRDRVVCRHLPSS